MLVGIETEIDTKLVVCVFSKVDVNELISDVIELISDVIELRMDVRISPVVVVCGASLVVVGTYVSVVVCTLESVVVGTLVSLAVVVGSRSDVSELTTLVIGSESESEMRGVVVGTLAVVVGT